MATGKTSVSAGLVFLSERDIDIVEAGNRVSTTFETLQHRVMRMRVQSETSALVKTRHHNVRLTLISDHDLDTLSRPADLVLAVEITRLANTQEPCPMSASSVLAHLLRVLQKAFYAEHVKWPGQDGLLDGRDFLQATAPLDKPGRTLTRAQQKLQPAPPTLHAALAREQIDDNTDRLDQHLLRSFDWAAAAPDQEALRDAMKPRPEEEVDAPQDDAQDIREETALLRLSAWFISVAVALFCLPVGAMLVVINLLRGENLRLASQTAALTGTFISLQAFGSMAQAATVLQSIIS